METPSLYVQRDPARSLLKTQNEIQIWSRHREGNWCKIIARRRHHWPANFNASYRHVPFAYKGWWKAQTTASALNGVRTNEKKWRYRSGWPRRSTTTTQNVPYFSLSTQRGWCNDHTEAWVILVRSESTQIWNLSRTKTAGISSSPLRRLLGTAQAQT